MKYNLPVILLKGTILMPQNELKLEFEDELSKNIIDEAEEFQHQVIIPIITQGDIIGAVVLLSLEAMDPMDEVEMKLAQSAADFLGKQMEQ